MATLGLDTATAHLTLAATVEGEPLLERDIAPDPRGRPRHSEMLLTEIEACAEAAGGWDRIERIAVGVGPGSFTGLRIGIATARALAQARGIPIAPVSTLSALARAIAESPAAAGRTALPVLDARRGQAFAATLAPGGELATGPAVCSPEQLSELARSLEPPPLAAGDGALRFLVELEAAGAGVPPPGDPVHRVAARHICALGDLAGTAALEAIEPVYLREPDAKRWIQRDDGTEAR